MNLVTWLARAALSDPGRVAIYSGERAWATYGELARRVAATAGGLRSRLGLAAGDRVAIVMKNSPEYLQAMYAAWWAGLAAVPINAKLHAKEVAYIVEQSGAKAVIESPDDVTKLEGGEPIACAERSHADLAWLFYTSGTTGRPKGAMLSHGNLAQMTYGYFASVDSVHRDGRLLHAAPLSHGSGLYTFTHLAMGAAQVVPESGAFDADEVLGLLRAHDKVSFFAAPTIVRRLVDAARGPFECNLQTIVYGGGPMYLADLRDAMGVFGNRLAQIYGQGETPMTITALSKAQHGESEHPRHAARLSSVGTPNAVVEVAVRDADGRELPAGDVGEICVRGGTVMSGYWMDPEASAAALRDGWLWTGDLGSFDDGGLPHVEGPQQGPHRERRIERLSPRGRGSAARPSRGGGGERRGAPRPRMGRSRRRLRGAARRGAECRRSRSPLPRPHRALQAPEGVSIRARASQEPLRQGREDGVEKGAGTWLSFSPDSAASASAPTASK